MSWRNVVQFWRRPKRRNFLYGSAIAFKVDSDSITANDNHAMSTTSSDSPTFVETPNVAVASTDSGSPTELEYYWVATTLSIPSARSTPTYASVPSGNTSITINVPKGLQVGDVLYACTLSFPEADSSPINPGAGWTYVEGRAAAGRGFLSVYKHPVDGTEPSSYNWTIPAGASQNSVVALAAFSATPFNSSPLHTINGGFGSATITATGITVPYNNSLLVMVVSTYNNGFINYAIDTYSSPLLKQFVTLTGYSQEMGMAWGTQVSAGASGNKTAAMNGFSGYYDAILLALLPYTPSPPIYKKRMRFWDRVRRW